MGMQLGVNGEFGDPQPYAGQATLRLPAASGSYSVAARLTDRAGNSTVVSATVALAPAAPPQIELADLSGTGATVVLSRRAGAGPAEAQVSADPTFADAGWQPLPLTQPWLWRTGRPRVAWLRFRDSAGAIGPPIPAGPDAWRLWLPLAS